jgi:hypothetical protein
MAEILTAREDRGRQLTWIEIGSVGGLEAPIPSAALRSARLDIVGSGIGSVPGRDFAKEIPQLADMIAKGTLDVRARAVPLPRSSRRGPTRPTPPTASLSSPDTGAARFRQAAMGGTVRSRAAGSSTLMMWRVEVGMSGIPCDPRRR